MTRFPRPVRDLVRTRAQGQCEYCHKPDRYSPHTPQIDHIIPRKHNGTDDPENLAWACFQCNVCKGTDFAAINEQTGEMIRLFNPRIQNWDDHFLLDDAEMVGKTAIGRVTIRILQMNHPDQIETRRVLIENGLWKA